MKLNLLKPYNGWNPIARCCKCSGPPQYADHDGEPFKAYYCEPCADKLAATLTEGWAMNPADDTKTFWATAKDNGTLAELVIPLGHQAQFYWAAYGGESRVQACIDIHTGRLTTAKYHQIEV